MAAASGRPKREGAKPQAQDKLHEWLYHTTDNKGFDINEKNFLNDTYISKNQKVQTREKRRQLEEREKLKKSIVKDSQNKQKQKNHFKDFIDQVNSQWIDHLLLQYDQEHKQMTPPK